MFLTALLTLSAACVLTREEVGSWDGVVLIVNFNNMKAFEEQRADMVALHALYAPAFAHIVFTGEPAYDASRLPYRFVVCTGSRNGWHFQTCFADVVARVRARTGYLFTNDDCIVNHWTLHTLNLRRFWLSPHGTNVEDVSGAACPVRWHWSNPEVCAGAKRAYAALAPAHRAQLARNMGGEHRIPGAFADIFYVPSPLVSPLVDVMTRTGFRRGVIMEITVPSVMLALVPRDEVEWFTQGGVLWGSDRAAWKRIYSPALQFIHPIKFSEPDAAAFIVGTFAIYSASRGNATES